MMSCRLRHRVLHDDESIRYAVFKNNVNARPREILPDELLGIRMR